MKKQHLLSSILICLTVLFLAAAGFAGQAMTTNPVATDYAYLDTATGHQYLRNQDGTYTEFSKRGKLLNRAVSADQPNLAAGKWMQVINPNNGLMYEKTAGGKTETRVVPMDEIPLVGWNCCEIVNSIVD
ncbi:MAG: hypothetical protein MI802_06660 [Desulfobacterales bacterium]|nr:hypothetical protein [Desulfobacterales bacterium]